ncbi:MAG: glycosyltransferase family 2 protein [Candidatus Sumerlaeaceae bacterium]
MSGQPAGQPGEPEPQHGTVRLSIIIVNWNTRDLLCACLDSLRSVLDDPGHEVLVVDNGSSDGSVEMVRTEFAAVRLLSLNQNLGFSRGNNVALAQARGKYLMLLNSDTEIIGDALETMCNFLDQNPTVGALGPQLLNPDGTVQLSCRTFPSYKTALFHRKSLITKLFPRNRFSQQYLMTGIGHGKTMEVDWVIGACLMTRRAVVEQVGLLDEEFFMYAEDVDWCYRMRLAGWAIVYVPEAQVLHHYEKSAVKMPYRMNFQRHRSMWRFYMKHYSRGIMLLDVATFIGIVTRFVLMLTRNAVHSAFGGEKRP